MDTNIQDYPMRTDPEIQALIDKIDKVDSSLCDPDNDANHPVVDSTEKSVKESSASVKSGGKLVLKDNVHDSGSRDNKHDKQEIGQFVTMRFSVPVDIYYRFKAYAFFVRKNKCLSDLLSMIVRSNDYEVFYNLIKEKGVSKKQIEKTVENFQGSK